jgi:hypothetical protein
LILQTSGIIFRLLFTSWLLIYGKIRNEKNENADEALSKIGITSGQLIDKISDIVRSLNPNNESFEQLQNRIQAFAAMTLTPEISVQF